MAFVIGLAKAITCPVCRNRQGAPTGQLTLDRTRHRTKLTARMTCEHCGYGWDARAPRIIQAAATKAMLLAIPIIEGRDYRERHRTGGTIRSYGNRHPV